MNPNTQQAEVTLEFDQEGARLFGKATKANLGKPLYIVLDDRVISAPVVNTVIEDGNAVIEGNFTAKEARILQCCCGPALCRLALVF
jgi:preprotein translocase subunit SecD